MILKSEFENVKMSPLFQSLHHGYIIKNKTQKTLNPHLGHEF